MKPDYESQIDEFKMDLVQKQKEVETMKLRLRNFEREKTQLLSTLNNQESNHKSEIAGLLQSQTQTELESL